MEKKTLFIYSILALGTMLALVIPNVEAAQEGSRSLAASAERGGGGAPEPRGGGGPGGQGEPARGGSPMGHQAMEGANMMQKVGPHDAMQKVAPTESFLQKVQGVFGKPTNPAEIKGFNPQPEPPGSDPTMQKVMPGGAEEKGIIVIGSKPGTGAEAVGFNPQPEPPGKMAAFNAVDLGFEPGSEQGKGKTGMPGGEKMGGPIVVHKGGFGGEKGIVPVDGKTAVMGVTPDDGKTAVMGVTPDDSKPGTGAQKVDPGKVSQWGWHVVDKETADKSQTAFDGAQKVDPGKVGEHMAKEAMFSKEITDKSQTAFDGAQGQKVKGGLASEKAIIDDNG